MRSRSLTQCPLGWSAVALLAWVALLSGMAGRAAADPYCTFAVGRNAVMAQNVSPPQQVSPGIYTLLLWPGFNRVAGDCVSPDGSKVTMPRDGWLEMEGEILLYRADQKTVSYAVVKPIANFSVDNEGHEINGADQPCTGQIYGNTWALAVPWSCRIWLQAEQYVGLFVKISSEAGAISVDSSPFHTHWSGRAGP